MKRSEMIEILTDLVLNKDTGFKLNEKEADLILTEIQSNGILPPVNRHMGYYWEDEEQIELPYNYEQTPDYLETIKWIKKGYCPCGDSNPETQAACSMNGCPMYKFEIIKINK